MEAHLRSGQATNSYMITHSYPIHSGHWIMAQARLLVLPLRALSTTVSQHNNFPITTHWPLETTSTPRHNTKWPCVTHVSTLMVQ